MKKLPLGVRLLLNVLIFSVPIVVLTFLMYQSETVNIDFGKKEKIGNQMQRPYEHLLRSVSLLKISEIGSERDLSRQLTSEIEKHLADLESKHAEIGESLLFTPEALKARQREAASLEALKGFWKEKKLDAMIASVKLSITQLGDSSNLILDPDLDSYYLMDVTLLALPQMQDRLQTILSQKSFVSADRTEAIRIQAALSAAMLRESDLGRALADAQTTFNEDPNFYGVSPSLEKNLKPAMDRLKQKTEAFTALLDQVAKNEPVDPAQWEKVGKENLEQAFDTWNVAVNELDALLAARVDSLSAQRAKDMVLAGLALLLAITFSVFVGFSLSQTIRNLLQSVLKLKDASLESSRVGSFLQEKAFEVSSSVETQSAAVERTAASVSEITSIVDLNANTTEEASKLAQNANDSAQVAFHQIQQMLKSMNEIARSSQKMVDAVTVIDDIAFQTNLLALNASVEAARAGEQGRGFAVVADAVRSLAQKSAESAKEINGLIQENVQIIEAGRKSADQSANVLHKITELIKKLNLLNNEVANASREQASGIGQISQSIHEMEKGTQETSESLILIRDSAESMLAQSQQLHFIVQILEKEILGREALEFQGAPDHQENMESLKSMAS